jgi:hypothetical protein
MSSRRVDLQPNNNRERDREFSINPAKRPISNASGNTEIRPLESIDSWINSNVHFNPTTTSVADRNERKSALLEVADLLLNDTAKFPGFPQMKAEVGELIEQLADASVVDDFIRFVLKQRDQPIIQQYRPVPPPAPQPPAYQQHPQMHHQPMYPQDPYFNPYMMHQPPPPPYGHYPHPAHYQPANFPPTPPSQGNMTLTSTGVAAATPVQKLKEREQKRKELLQMYSEKCRELVEKLSTIPESSASERTKVLGLIEDIKAKIKKISTSSVPNVSSTKPKEDSTIKGYFGNVYVNPTVLKKQEESSDNQTTS